MMKRLEEVPASILDLATIIQGDRSAGEAFKRSLENARHAEKLGYKRYWFAEHHNMESVASSATSVLIGYVAAGTSSIRLGSGGVMLPNHAPLIIAEQFGTLASIYPGRIDLGLGRAPGTDPLTSMALRRNLKGEIDNFPSDVVELINYLGPRSADAKVRAVPGEGTNVPVWLLGSSTYSAQLAGILGLPFAFAAHFAPTHLMNALEVYRNSFQPGQLQSPYAMVCVNAIASDTEEEANKLATSLYQMALGLFRNDRKPLPPPVDSMNGLWSDQEKAGVMHMMHYSFLGTKESISESLQDFINTTNIDEIMFTSHIYDAEKKKKSMELVSSLFRMNKPQEKLATQES